MRATTTVGSYEAVIPSISGRAWITSINQLVLDPSDPPAGGSHLQRHGGCRDRRRQDPLDPSSRRQQKTLRKSRVLRSLGRRRRDRISLPGLKLRPMP
ncbi:proline racemase family protein [Arthrobacter pascens]|uniref:proline racemase family protein n=1 Tax=Arthrobacter pascens TaxID=1677 RepID=UPI0027D83A4C|nr:proline racemase family protein [Arthrobacter pascens]